MEALVLVGIFVLVGLLGFVKRDRTIDGAEVSLCLTCASSVVTRGTRNEEWIACNYGGAMRAVKFTVSSCSGFSGVGSTNRLVTIEGFVREEREVYAEAAIS
jgi:hypothetical protein